MPATSLAVADLDFTGFGAATPSPSAWEDEVLYFLLVDRFSDGREDGVATSTARSSPGRPRRCAPATRATRCGPTPTRRRGVPPGRELGRRHARRGAQQARLPRRLGVTALWISPVLSRPATRSGGGQLPRLRHPGLPRRRPAVRRRRGPARAGRGRARGRAPGHPGRRPQPRGRRVRLRPHESFEPAGTAASTRSTAGGRRDGLVPFTPEAAAAAWPDGAVHPAELHRPRASPGVGGSSTGTGTPSTSRATSRASRTSRTAAVRSTATGPRPRWRR